MPFKRVFLLKPKSLRAKLRKKTKNLITTSPETNDTNGTFHIDNEHSLGNENPGCSSWNVEPPLEPPLEHTSDEQDSDGSFESESESVLSESDAPDCSLEIKDFLATWAMRHNTSHVALNELLQFFKNDYNTLPCDARTLLKTPKCKEIQKVPPGEYIHIGLQNSIEFFLKKIENFPSEIKLNFNIDGVPLSKSSSSCFWPILCKANVFKRIIVIGIYHGYSQPKDFNLFLRPFVNELKQLMSAYTFRGKSIQIKVRAFILDTPARSHVLGIKSHTAYFGCCRCTQEGEYFGRVTFPEMNAAKRTNASFRNNSDEHFHNRNTILNELDIDLVDQFVLDYLHLVLLGVVKKLLKMWTSGKIESLLPSKSIMHIEELLRHVQKFNLQIFRGEFNYFPKSTITRAPN